MTSANTFKFTVERLRQAMATIGNQTAVVFHDAEVSGLQLRVQRGSAAYIVRYRVAGAQMSGSRRLTLGRYGVMSLDTARKEALSAIVAAKSGTDPLEAKRDQAQAEARARLDATSLASFLEEYSEHQAKEKILSAPERITAIRQHLPQLMRAPMGSISRRQLVEALDAIAKKYPAAAEKLRASLHHVFEIALDRDVIGSNPLAHRRRQRGSVKAKNLQKEAEKEKALSITDLARVWLAAGHKDVNPVFGAYLRTIIATGARRAELAAAEINNLHKAANGLPARLILKGLTTKTGVTHTLYLPPLVLAEITQLQRHVDYSLVFPGRRRNNVTPPISGWSKLIQPVIAAAKELGVTSHIHLHGLRHSFRTGLSAIGVDRVVAEKLMNHAADSKVVQIYDHHQFEHEQAEASARWCATLEAAIVELNASSDNAATFENIGTARAKRAKRSA
jgi:integrase